MELGVTIVVCTYNGASLLPETLAHIAQQQVPPHIPWEVLVVDNASTDNTSDVIRAEWARSESTVPFMLLHQARQGLTFARELALEKARYEYILFCDDDNWLAPDYVSLAYDLMQQHPSVGALGGCGELAYEIPPPAWAAALPLFANGPQAVRSGKVSRNSLYGAGCVIRKSAYDVVFRAGFVPMLTDRVAAKLSSGGDYEFCYALALTGYDIWYDERLRFKHFMPKDRLEWSYYERFFKERAQCFEVLVPYQIIVNAGVQDTTSFYLKLLRLFMSFIKRFYKLMLKRRKQPAGSDAALVSTLRLKALKARIWSFRRFFVMQKNFTKILKFKQEKLPAFTRNQSLFSHDQKLRMKIR